MDEKTNTNTKMIKEPTNYIFYNSKKVSIDEINSFGNIYMEIIGENNYVYLNEFTGKGRLDIKLYCNNSKLLFGKSNVVNNTVYLLCLLSDGKSIENVTIEIGDNNFFNGNVVVLAPLESNNYIRIGAYNLFAGNIYIRGRNDHIVYDKNTKKPLNKEISIEIGDRNWLCENVQVLPKTKINNDNVCGLNSLLNKNYDVSNSLLAGTPAVVKRKNICWSRSSFEDGIDFENPINIKYKKDIVNVEVGSNNMDKVLTTTKKCYYLYCKMPKPIKLIIKGFYCFLRSIYRFLKKIAFFFKKKEDKTISEKILEDKTTPKKILNDDFYLKNTKLKKGKLNISWVIPLPIEGSGGHRNFYRVIRFLANSGHNVTVYIDPENYYLNNGVYTGKDAQKFISEKFFDINSNIVMGLDNIKECDILFATHNSGAYCVKANEHKAKMCCYFIQDNEACFHPMGDDYIKAYETYKFGFYPITSGYWPLNFLKKMFNINDGYAFKFPINKKIYYFNSFDEKDNNQVAFFAKPFMPRRCYGLGISALEIVKKERPNTKIIFYGANKNDYQNIPFDFINYGLVPTIDELGDLYRASSVGLAFSTTNPSLVPYEMMACGCTVVDLDFNDNIISYESDENVSLADPNPEKVAQAIIELLDNQDLRIKKAKNGMKLCDSFPTEKKMCKGIEDALLKEYSRREQNEK